MEGINQSLAILVPMARQQAEAAEAEPQSPTSRVSSLQQARIQIMQQNALRLQALRDLHVRHVREIYSPVHSNPDLRGG